MENETLNRQHYKVEYIDAELNKKYVPKKAYDTELKAQQMCFFLNLQPTSITKMVSYKCPVCHKWHIGHGGKKIDTAEREKIRLQYEKWKIVNQKFG